MKSQDITSQTQHWAHHIDSRLFLTVFHSSPSCIVRLLVQSLVFMQHLKSRILVTSDCWHLGQLNSASLGMNPKTCSATTPANTDEKYNNKGERKFESQLAVSLAFRANESFRHPAQPGVDITRLWHIIFFYWNFFRKRYWFFTNRYAKEQSCC